MHTMGHVEPLYSSDVNRGQFERYFIWDKVRDRVRGI